MRLPRQALGAAVAVLVAVVIVRPSLVSADRGVRIDAGRIAVDESLSPGQTYHLPTLGVSDPGDERASYTMHVSQLEGTRAPDASWFEFDPAAFDLDPGQTQPVTVTMRIPTSAEPGDYIALLAAQIGSNTGPGVGMGAAAAARLTFTVRPANELAALLNVLGSWFADNRAWVLPLAAVLGLVLGVWFARRHLSVEVRRR